MARQGDYLFQRAGSKNWYLKLQYPKAFWAEGKRKVEKSLGTDDHALAEALAAPLITEHKKVLYVFRAGLAARRLGLTREQFENTLRFKHTQEPLTTIVNPDGSRSFATETHIFTLAPDNKVLNTQPNETVAKVPMIWFTPTQRRELRAAQAHQKKVKFKDVDAEVLEAYIAAKRREGKLRKDDEDGARRTLADFKSLTEGKPIAHSSREEAHLLADLLVHERGLSAGRTRKLIAFMKAAINRDMEDPRNTHYKYNIFANVSVSDDEEGSPDPLTEADMDKVRANLHLFTDEQRLMWVWHASSSIRPVGLYSIAACEWEDGEDAETGNRYRTRFVRIRKDKNKFGTRSLPIPQAVLDLKAADGTPLLPDRIQGPLFSTPRPQLLAEINRVLDKIGVLRDTDNKRVKTLYSCRHRAKDRMLTRGASSDMRKAIMGHAREIQAHDLYGHGFPMWQVKLWIDKIGY